MTIGKKIALSSLFLLLSVIYLLYGIFASKAQVIYDSRKELAGVQAVVSATAALAGIIDGSDVHSHMQNIASETARIRTLFDVEQENKTITQHYNAAKVGEHPSHDLIESLQGYIAAVTDKSGMILDPAANTFYLMDAFCVQIPNIIVTVHNIIDILENYGSNGTLSSEESKLLFEKNGTLKIFIGNLQGDLAKIESYANLSPALKTEMDALPATLLNVEKYVGAVSSGQTIDISSIRKELIGSIGGFSSASDKFAKSFSTLVNERIDGFKEESIEKTIISAIIFVITMIGLQAFIQYAIISPLRETSRNLNGIVDSSLVQFRRIQSELGNITSNVVESVIEGRESATSSASASNQISSSVQNVASSIEEFSVTTDNILRRAQITSETARVTVQMTEDVSQKISHLNEMSQSIDEIVSVINRIAEQTNLLSLNATIESARAGEAGKGFGVVANEVKNLAVQTQDATIKIKEQITAIKESIEQAKMSTDAILVQINNVMAETDDITGQIQEQSAASGHIGRNVVQAAEGTEQVNKGILNVTRLVEVTNDLTQELIVSQKAMEKETKSLSHVMETFNGDLKRMVG